MLGNNLTLALLEAQEIRSYSYRLNGELGGIGLLELDENNGQVHRELGE
jgi:hypothetical protein